MVRTLCLPQSDPPPLWNLLVTTLLIVARWAGLIRKGRVQLKTGLKLWENILQTVRGIDFQIIEVKGIAVNFIYSKSLSLNFQLLVEVVIKKRLWEYLHDKHLSLFFSVYLFFMIPYSCQSIWSWEQGYPVWAWQSSICGAVSGKKKQIFVYVATRACSDYWRLNSMFQAFS